MRTLRALLLTLACAVIPAAAQTITTTSLPDGTVGVTYSAQVACTNCGTGAVWSIQSGALPPTLTISTSTGLISGNPTTAGTYNFTVEVANLPPSIPATKALSITILTPLSNQTTAFPDGSVGVVYPTHTLSATGGQAPYTWSVLPTDPLPPGLSIVGSTVAGTPTTSGTYPIILQVTDSLGNTASADFTIIITIRPVINTASLPNGNQNVQYSTSLSCTNCKSWMWSVPTGLPPGLSVDAVTGTISGLPTTAGNYPFTVFLSFQGNNPPPAVTKSLSINIIGPLSITTTSLPGGAVNNNYTSPALAATGGLAPYTWNVTSGLPPGLGLAVTSGGTVISGVPTIAGTYPFTLIVVDSLQNSATKSLSIVISTGAAITTVSLPSGIVGQAYSAQLACTACAGGTWALASGTLPPVLSISASGAITGTASTAGTYNFVVSLTIPSKTSASSVTQALSITINPPLAITAITLPVANVNTSYTATLTGSGGSPPYSWSLTSTANDGLAIGALTGIISGTPAVGGQFTLGAMITDSGGSTATRLFTLYVASTLTLSTASLPNGVVGTVYPLQTLAANGGQAPFRWTISVGTLPPGLNLNGTFGTISGTPTSTGTYPFTLAVTDTLNNTANAPLSITITAAGIIISPSTLPAGSVGTSYSQALTAAGGAAPYTWAIFFPATGATSLPGGTLPAGLTLNPATGLISGTPTAAGTSTFMVLATDANKLSGQTTLSITITATPLSVTTTTLPNATVNAVYSQTLAATGGTSPYSWTITSGTLPTGLTLNATTGVISGTPTQAATSPFTVQVTDANKTTAQAPLSIVVASATPLTVTTTALANGTVGSAYSQTLAATGGTAPYSWLVTTGALPAGLTLNTTTGAIAGTPSAVASPAFTVTVTDAAKNTAQKSLSISVAAPISVSSTLPAAVAGTGYSQAITATGGVPPYKFAVTSGSLPSGFSLSSSGTLSGTAPSAETSTFTVTVTDSVGATASARITLSASVPAPPTVTLAGVPANSGFSQQLTATPTISASYPVDISGTITLTFAPSVTPPVGSTGTIDDLMIRFSNGTRTVNFTIPAGSTTAGSVTVLTGTTAGTITLTTTLTASGASLGSPVTQTIVNNPGVPFISKVTLTQVPGGVTVTVTGFSSTRDMSNAQFAFVPGTNDTFNTNDVSVALNSVFATWYANTAQSNPFGTQFTLTVPFAFTIANGSSVSSVVAVSVTVTLSNSKGASNPVTLSQ